MENCVLIHNVKDKQYEFHTGAYVARIVYTENGDGVINLILVEVPPALEGQGIGRRLLEKTLADVAQQGLRIIPVCPFVTAYLKRHPDWQHIVVQKEE